MKRTLSTLTLLVAMLTALNAWATGGMLTGNGSSMNPYIINDLADWNTFAGWLNNGTTAASYVGKYYKLGADIGTAENPVTMMASEYYSNPFRGNFNGNGHTITVALTRTDIPEGDEHLQGLALFHYAGDGCNIHDLHVAGTINTCGKFGAGFIAYISNGSNSSFPKVVSISRCRSSVVITSTVEGDASSAGFVGASKKYVNLVLNNCRFDGAFVSSTATQFCGMVGWQDGSGHANTLNCLVKPGAGMNLTAPDGNHYTYCRYGGESFGMSNSYYYAAIGTEQGNAVGDMGNDDLLSALGAAWLMQDDEVLPYAISYHYTMMDNLTATDVYALNNIIPDHSNFGYAKMVDGDKSTYWDMWPIDWTPFSIDFQSEKPFMLKGYVLTMSPFIQDNPRHNPVEWQLLGKNADGDWEVIDHRGGWQVENHVEFYCDENLPAMNSAEKVYLLTDNNKAYQYFQLEFDRVAGWDNQGHKRFEMAELQLLGLLNNRDLTNACITGVESMYLFNGIPFEVNYIVTDYNGNILTEGIDYTTTFTDFDDNPITQPISATGVYTMTITGTGNEDEGYFGSQYVDFRVTDHPIGLSVDPSIPVDSIGHYYINLPKNRQTIIDLNSMTPAFTNAFNVYDDRGKHLNYTKGCTEDLLVIAPEGYVLQVTGTVDNAEETVLEFYDGTWDGTLLAGHFDKCAENVGVILTTSPQLAIKYRTSPTTARGGLFLTVTPVPANTISAIAIGDDVHGSATAYVNNSAVTSATVNDYVTLTATPTDGYLPNDFTATDALGNPVFVTGGWYSGNNATFTMPGSTVNITPHFVPTSVSENEPIQLSVNIPRISNSPADALVATIPESVPYFKVYDNGGPDGDYSHNSDGYLLLVAPEGKVIQLTAVTMENVFTDDFLEVFDGNTTENPLGGPYSYHDELGTLTSTGNQMLLHFVCNDNYLYSTDDGLDLIARVYGPNDEFAFTVNETEHGTLSPSSGSVGVGSKVTMTFTANEGYLGYRPQDFTTNLPTIPVEGGWFSNNELTFTMPAIDVTITPNYTNAVTAEDGLYVNMPKKNTYATSKMINIPVGISSFKIYDDGGKDNIYSNFTDGYMTLTAPEGYRLKLTGYVISDGEIDYLDIFDGNTPDQLIGRYGEAHYLFDGSGGYSGEDLGEVISSGQSLLLHFTSSSYNNFSYYDGIDIKAELVTTPSPFQTFYDFAATAGQDGDSDPTDAHYWVRLVDNIILDDGVWRTTSDEGVGFRTNFVEFHYTEPIVPKKYHLITGNRTKQYPNRLPKSWTLKGKLNETDEWTTIAAVEDDNILLPINYYDFEFSLADNHQAFQYFRFDVLSVQGHEAGQYEHFDSFVMELSELYFKGYKASDVHNDLAFATISGVEPIYTYTGSPIVVNYTVTNVNGEPLTDGTDYLGAISPSPVQATGEYELTISAKDGGDYIGNQSLHFRVNDYPIGVEVDNVYESPTQLGYYYVNMPKTGTKTVDFSHPEGFTTSIKIYDDGGMSGNYSNECDGNLLLQAPEGYLLQLTGTVTSDVDADYLSIHNGSTTYAPILGKEKFGSEDGEDIGTLTTTGRDMLLHFHSSYSSNWSGLNLTLSLISITEPRTISVDYVPGGTATANPNPASVGSIVTLTPSSNPGYLIYDFIAKDTYDHDLEVTGSWYENSTFIMPGNEVTVTPVATHRLSTLGGLYVNMTRNVDMSTFHPQTVNIPEGVSSFKVYDNGGKDGNFHIPCNDALVLNTPEGYVLRVEGTGNYSSIGFSENLKIFNGQDWTIFEGGSHVVIGPITTVGNQMQLQFHNTNSGHSGFDLTITVYKPNTWGEGTDGSAEHPYEISNIDGLNTLAALSESDSFADKYFKLTTDIGTETTPLRKVIGDNTDYPFCGHFDGNGHTITVALTNGNAFDGEDEAEQGTALFHYAGNGCTIQNLTVAGTINTANKFAAGFIAYIKADADQNIKTITIDNCCSSVEITSTHEGDNTTGGFIGLVKEYVNLTLSNCVFDGAFVSTLGTQFSGFVGYLANHVTATINNGIMAGDLTGLGLKDSGHYIFCRYNEHSVPTFSGINYYHGNIGTAQGTKAYRLTLPIGITTIRNNGATLGNDAATLYTDGFNLGDTPYYTSYNNGPTVTLAPKTNFSINEAIVNYGENISWAANANGDGTFWFNMPADDVTVTAAMDLHFTVEGYGESNGKWVFLANPTVADITPSLDNHFLVVPESDYDLYRFNQSAEAEWENFKIHYNDGSFRTLTNGRGYLYARKETYTLTFSSPFNWRVSQDIDLDYDANATAKGWNLVGNPFPVDAYADKPYFKMNANGDDLIVEEDYTTTPIPACTGIMVRAEGEGEKVTFTSIPKYHGQEFNHGRLIVEVFESGERAVSKTVLDKAILSFHQGRRLKKFVFNEDNTKLYIPKEGINYAIAYSENQGETMCNFKAAKDGVYTISFVPKHVELDYLHLIDNKTGADIDLLTTFEYTFNATTTDNESRFRLVFSAHGLPEVTETATPAFAYYADGEIRLLVETEGHATLQVIDMMGRSVRCTNVARNVSTSGMVPGVYVLRLIQGEKAMTQKIVIQ